MTYHFFCYEIVSRRIILALPGLPDDIDFEEKAEIKHNGQWQMRGIKWDAVDWWYNDEPGVVMDDFQNGKYLFIDDEIALNPEFADDE